MANTEALKSVLSTCREDYDAALQQINLMEDLAANGLFASDVPSRAERVVMGKEEVRARLPIFGSCSSSSAKSGMSGGVPSLPVIKQGNTFSATLISDSLISAGPSSVSTE